MKNRILLAVVATALSVAPMVAGTARGDTTPNLSGTWRLDRARSDTQGGTPGSHGSKNWGALKSESAGGASGATATGHSKRGHGGAGGGASSGLPRIPALFSLAMATNALEMKDSTSALVERIVMADPGSVPPSDANGVPQVHGGWQGQTLQVDLTGPSGGKATQAYELADGGQTLKITTQLPAGGQRKAPRTFTRVYSKVSGS